MATRYRFGCSGSCIDAFAFRCPFSVRISSVCVRSDSQTIDCVFAEPPEPGTYTLVVACRNGMRESLKPATAKVKNVVVKA